MEATHTLAAERFLMKLCVVSPFENASKAEILAFLSKARAKLILLPGKSRNTPSPENVRDVIARGVSVFVEGCGRKKHTVPYLVTKRRLLSMPQQIFSRRPQSDDIRKLEAALADRTFAIGNRTITFFICGEITAFNPDGSVKHGGQFQYDVVANPVHTIMGHWNHLGEKLRQLSIGSVALYAANNDRNRNSLRTDVRIYKNGRLIIDRHSIPNITWAECVL